MESLWSYPCREDTKKYCNAIHINRGYSLNLPFTVFTYNCLNKFHERFDIGGILDSSSGIPVKGIYGVLNTIIPRTDTVVATAVALLTTEKFESGRFTFAYEGEMKSGKNSDLSTVGIYYLYIEIDTILKRATHIVNITDCKLGEWLSARTSGNKPGMLTVFNSTLILVSDISINSSTEKSLKGRTSDRNIEILFDDGKTAFMKDNYFGEFRSGISGNFKNVTIILNIGKNN